MDLKVNPLFKTFGLIGTGILFGYAIGKKNSENIEKTSLNNEDNFRRNKESKELNLDKLLERKLKNYPEILNRKFVPIEEIDENYSNKLRIMQWNMLARGLWFPENDSKIYPPEVYDWDNFRLWRTLQELTRYNSDIICVEEVDEYESIKNFLHKLGYSSVFFPKYSSPSFKFTTNFGPDGSAIFYRLSMFQINNMSCEKFIIDGEVDSQILAILQLKHKPSNKLLTVVCVHLKSSERFAEKRERQIKQVVSAIKLHLSGSLIDIKNHPLFLCGDFNGEPFEKFYDLIVNDNEIKTLRDAYSVISEPKQPTFYKYVDDKNPILGLGLDYIFFNQSGAKLLGYLELPLNDELINEKGLPNIKYSSDHLSLVCDFELI